MEWANPVVGTINPAFAKLTILSKKPKPVQIDAIQTTIIEVYK